MKIVTGYRGEPHITSQDHQSFYQGVFGRQMYVLGTGNEFEAQLTDTNTITVSDGDGIMQGCHFRIDLGEEENIVMEPGSSGMYRNDLLVARYSKDAATGVENVQLVAITGTPTEGTPEVPEYNSGEIVNGETVDFPLYRVHFSGFTIDDIIPLFFIMPSLESVYQSHEALADNVDQAIAALTARVNRLIRWTWFRQLTGTAWVSIAKDSCYEIMLITKVATSGGAPVHLTQVIQTTCLPTDGTTQIFASRWGGAYDGDVVWAAYLNGDYVYVKLYAAYSGSTSITNSAQTRFYYR